MHQYKKLLVWSKSVDFCVDIYKLTEEFPDHEKFGLRAQMNKSVVSISSNIAEGSGRNTQKDFSHFIGIALGSTCELETQLLISNRLNYINNESLESSVKKLEEIQKMLNALKKSLNQSAEPDMIYHN